MLHHWKLYLLLVLVLSLSTLDVRAQKTERAESHAPLVTATAAPERVRFTALGEAAQLRLEVFSLAGDKLFDSEARAATFLDWKLQDQLGQRLADGTYRCLLTVKAVSGSPLQAHGLILVQAGEVSVQTPDATALPRTDQQGLTQVDRQELLATVPAGSALATALLAHDGNEGRLVSGSGALSFRLGDFFAGKDQEQMRLTAEGNLGIGITAPKAKLDVAGSIRTSEGIIFPDGTIQTTAAKALAAKQRLGQDPKTDEEGKPLALKRDATQNISGTGTTNRITKWTDGPNGVVGDSTLTESGGNIGIGTSAPITGLDYRHTLAPFFTRDIGTFNFGGTQSAIQIGVTNIGSRNVNVGPSFLFFADDTAGQKEFLGRLSAAWENPTNGQEAGSIRFQVRANSADTGAGTERMRITAAGKIGIGTASPGAMLEVSASSSATTAVQAFTSTNGSIGVSGNAGGTNSIGVIGLGSGIGVRGHSSSGTGVDGESVSSYAVRGSSAGAGAVAGVYGTSTGAGGNGVIGEANNGTSAYGVWGKSTSGVGVRGSGQTYGVHGSSPNVAGYFEGIVNVTRGLNIDQLAANSGAIQPGLSFGLNSGEGIASRRTAGANANQFGLDFYTNFTRRMLITQSGDVGIGLGAGVLPTAKLHVVGAFLKVEGANSEQAYLGGDGVSNDVQLGSTNGTVTKVALYNPSSQKHMTLDVAVLNILGGSDLAEPFDVRDAATIQPGFVVAIDPAQPGRLRIADKAYDHTVAGIISGAGGVNPGMLMRQTASIADGSHPVALTGRVYCWADAANGPIKPGDLLTTSATPGHAMKVAKQAKAQGAIIGKAMTGLTHGKGLVLVLVSLQ